MKEVSKMVRWKEQGYLSGLMVKSIGENTKKTKSTERGKWNGNHNRTCLFNFRRFSYEALPTCIGANSLITDITTIIGIVWGSKQLKDRGTFDTFGSELLHPPFDYKLYF